MPSTEIIIGTAYLNSMVDDLVDAIDDGSGAGVLEIYDSGDVLLGTLTFSDPAFGDSAAGVATADTITKDDSADASGTADYFIAKDSDDNEIFRGSVGESGSGEAVILNSVTIVITGDIECSAMTVTLPNT